MNFILDDKILQYFDFFAILAANGQLSMAQTRTGGEVTDS